MLKRAPCFQIVSDSDFNLPPDFVHFEMFDEERRECDVTVDDEGVVAFLEDDGVEHDPALNVEEDRVDGLDFGYGSITLNIALEKRKPYCI